MHDAPSKSGSKLLPESAYRKLKPGETYEPIVPAADKRAEVTFWSIGLGVIMVVIFSAACVYMALRAGNAIEAAIPIAILAIFFGRLKKVKSTILENVMVQSVGQASGVVAAGATFVIPALYINQQAVSWWQILLACTVGGFLGIVLIIPLRKYFVKDMHGELPFPEATAINEILVTGESTAGGAGKILLLSFALGAAFDFLVEGAALWNADISTTAILGSFGKDLSGIGIELKISGIAALFGLGYIIGIKYAAIIASGSVLAVLVMVPVIKLLGGAVGGLSYAGKIYDLGAMGPGQIFGAFVKPIGIGAIAIAGLIGILRMGKIVAGSVTLGFKGLSRKAGGGEQPERTQLDLTPKSVLLFELASMLAMGVLFFVVAAVTPLPGDLHYSTGECLTFAVVGMVVGFLLSFLFTPVAAQAIAIVGVNPVSGMTLITVVLAIVAMILTGLSGSAGMVIALIIGTAVCTALSTSGALITDFKIGYWIGSTPRNQQKWKFLGVIIASLVVALVIPLMNDAYKFLIQDPTTGLMVSNDKVLPAPQANMLAAVSNGLMSDPANQPWLLYGVGGLVAVLLFMAGVPMLAFALGMYLPLSINLAVLGGAAVAWAVSKTGGTEEVRKMRGEQGTLIASGLMAGAAIIGLFTAVMRLPQVGAPIRFLAVGQQYSYHVVVDGQDLTAAPSCDFLRLAPGAKCEVRDVQQGWQDPVREVVVDGAPYAGPTTCEELRIRTPLQCEVRQIVKPNLVPEIWVDGKKVEGAATCKELKLPSGRRCEMREVQQGWRPPRTVVYVDSKPFGPLTSCDQLLLAAGRTCAVKETRPPKMAAQLFVDGRPRAPVASCSEVDLKPGQLCNENLASEPAAWYEGREGQLLGLGMLGVLAILCYLLASLGAKWALRETPPAEDKPKE
jgi:putative OPT family oligopeptide transporter